MVMSLNVQSQETKSMKSDHFENTVRVRFHLLDLMANESSCRLLCFSKVCLSRHLFTLICHLTFSFFPLRRSNRNYFDTLDATTAKTAPLSTIKVIMIQLILAVLSFLSPRSHLCPPPPGGPASIKLCPRVSAWRPAVHSLQGTHTHS